MLYEFLFINDLGTPRSSSRCVLSLWASSFGSVARSRRGGCWWYVRRWSSLCGWWWGPGPQAFLGVLRPSLLRGPAGENRWSAPLRPCCWCTWWRGVLAGLEGPRSRIPRPRRTWALDDKLKLSRRAFEPASERCSPSTRRRAEFTSPFLQRKVPSWSAWTQPRVSASCCRRELTSVPLAAASPSSVRGQIPPSVTCPVDDTRFAASTILSKFSTISWTGFFVAQSLLPTCIRRSPNSLFFILFKIFRMSLVLHPPCDLITRLFYCLKQDPSIWKIQ